MNDRHSILKHNQAIREGRAEVRRLDDGEVVFKIPVQDMKVLSRIFPDLIINDHTARLAAWKKLRSTPIAEKYLVTRTPNQVKRHHVG